MSAAKLVVGAVAVVGLAVVCYKAYRHLKEDLEREDKEFEELQRRGEELYRKAEEMTASMQEDLEESQKAHDVRMEELRQQRERSEQEHAVKMTKLAEQNKRLDELMTALENKEISVDEYAIRAKEIAKGE